MSLLSWLTLKAIRGLGERSIKKLYLSFRDPDRILDADLETLESIVGRERAKSIKQRNLSFDPEKVVSTIEKEGINYVLLGEENYPKSLLEIEDPPPVLFFIGDFKNKELIGIVGTRRPHNYSIDYTRELVENILNINYGVVSGGAKGIDWVAHSTCTSIGGYTVCVLGMGILRAPRELKDMVLKSGCLVSEFLPDEHAERFSFPRRNRIISGLSKALFVIEAGKNSGALITADYAYKQGRPVRVHIGFGKSERWRGCVDLINWEKAKFIMQPQEVKTYFSPSQEIDDSFLSFLSTPTSFDKIQEYTKLSTEDLLIKLTQYEMEGKIQRVGNLYIKKNV